MTTHPVDYNAEARALWQRLNIDPTQAVAKYQPLNAIWKCPTGGGTIYVGNQNAASSLPMLVDRGITHVVNCTDDIPNFHDGKLTYLNFPICDWQYEVGSTNEGVLAFVQPLFAFMDSVISHGGSVLVHCLAGAHRAGTTGCACLIHYASMDAVTATRTAKALRSIIEPIYDFAEFLKRLDAAEAVARKK